MIGFGERWGGGGFVVRLCVECGLVGWKGFFVMKKAVKSDVGGRGF